MKLNDTQHLFWRAVRFDPAPPEVDEAFVDHEDLSGRDRMAIYREMYWARQVSALQVSFERLLDVLGLEAFNKLASRYIRRHPSEHGALERLGRHMGAFLQEEGHPAWLVDLGRLEWERIDALLSEDDPGLAALSDIDPARFAEQIPHLSRSLRVVRLHVGALRRFAGEPLPDEDREVPVAIWRRGHGVKHKSLSPEEAEACALAARGRSLGEICTAFSHHPDPVQAAFAVLLPWFERQWISSLD